MNSPALQHDLQADIDAIARISAIPTILDVVCRSTGMGFAAVARVTDDRWVACQVLDNIDFGLKAGSELKLETTICDEIRQSHKAVIIDNVSEDIEYCGHKTPAMYGFQSYISMPIIHKNGKFFGTLCAIDPRPARLNNPQTIGMFKLFTELIAAHLDSDEELRISKAELLEEKYISELREQFIAVLGHDLRNPLASISTGTALLMKDPTAERRSMILDMIQSSVLRMVGLIDNVLDFARGRLGAGIPLALRADILLPPILDHIVSELQIVAPDRIIQTDINLPTPIKCDPSRIGQLVSNLLGNALTHGKPEKPIRLNASNNDGILTICVANASDPIPPAIMERLFQPFFRGEVRASQQGLGLGLHIASEIAKAHGGILSVASTPEETRFTFQMPVAA